MRKEQPHIDYVHLPQKAGLVDVQPLDYPNPYDFKSLHRHDYFEVIFVTDGAGSQLIDFKEHSMRMGDVFMIYPGQVHLMNRHSTQGLVLQFEKAAFDHMHPLKHHNFYNKSSALHCDSNLFAHLTDIALRIQILLNNTDNISLVTQQKMFSYLQIILISFIETQHANIQDSRENMVLSQFIALITDNIKDLKKVSDYTALMNCSADKLNEACKKGLGKTALEIIHEELLLEIRRMLLLQELSFKEIAYSLNFDTQGNFNAFVKSKTQLTPKQLQQSVLDIYN